MHHRKVIITIFFISLTLFIAPYAISFVQAAAIDDLKNQISNHNDLIKQLEAEIAAYNKELDKTSAQALTLKRNIDELNLSSKKLAKDIDLTRAKIGVTNETIKELSSDITEKQESINQNKIALARSLQRINETDSKSLLETILNYPNLSALSQEIETQGQFQQKVQEHLDTLLSLKKNLEVSKSRNEEQKNNLVSLQSDLSSQKTAVEITKTEKDKLLAQTKNQESAFKKIIADKEAKRKAFEQELLQFESQLKIAIDPNSIPSAKKGVLAWPLAKYTITQTFGVTEFSRTTNAYNGKGHNGIDLATPVGSKVMAAESGIVAGSGNTDSVCPGASYGKWILIKHNNGLSTLYAHLSSINVSNGAQVNLGDVIGYSGNTGYSTGPHLHFTVYASQGVEVLSRKSVSCGGTYVMPIADLKAYLNPMIYL